jgi:hypothetical protein
MLCTDFDCEGIRMYRGVQRCVFDGIDNDVWRHWSLRGMGCQALSACTRELSNAKCSDGADNDEDGDADCQDEDCQSEGIVVCDGTTAVDIDPADYEMLSNEICTNGINDDASPENTFIDCNDNSCVIPRATA